MANASKAWHQITRICDAMKADPDDMYRRGRAFLQYYRQICSMPEYALAPEPQGADLRNHRVFLDEMTQICGAETGDMQVLLEDSYLSPVQLRHLVTDTMVRLSSVDTCGAIYREIVSRKYLGTFPMTDAEISELMAMSGTAYYGRHKEACAYFMLTMANAVLPRMREELLQAEREARLQPREVVYG